VDEVALLTNDLENSGLKKTRAGIRHALSHPPISLLAQSEPLRGMAQSILGNSAFPFRATLFDKSFESNWLVVWHQDTALPLRRRQDATGWGPWSSKDGIIYAHAPKKALSQVVALRFHLDDCSTHNGPLKVLPESHKEGVLSDQDIEAFCTRIKAVDCVVPRGGILAMSPLLIHSSSKSLEGNRRVLHIEYAASADLGQGLELAIT
jgi:hypothetical protein